MKPQSWSVRVRAIGTEKNGVRRRIMRIDWTA